MEIDVSKNMLHEFCFWCQKFKAKSVCRSLIDSKSAESWAGFMCQDIDAKWRSLASIATLIRRIGRVNLDVGTCFRYIFLAEKIVKYDGCLLQKSGSSIVIFCIADIWIVMVFPHVSSCVLSVGFRLRRLGSMFSTNLREALSVSSSARMMPQDRNDVTKFSRKNATFLWENCAKFLGKLVNFLVFFFRFLHSIQIRCR